MCSTVRVLTRRIYMAPKIRHGGDKVMKKSNFRPLHSRKNGHFSHQKRPWKGLRRISPRTNWTNWTPKMTVRVKHRLGASGQLDAKPSYRCSARCHLNHTHSTNSGPCCTHRTPRRVHIAPFGNGYVHGGIRPAGMIYAYSCFVASHLPWWSTRNRVQAAKYGGAVC